ncbi:tRNA (adenosine(37)-N6)-threonylcarbamoyltransferase complex transferase subunit TsaD [Patescibacteria group bacterium]|nr:tRNA (adenosine(37)-N6)-threonylcarbamoyltransferase complex transferase subunit TsaD [Patescibacteria group bacterium]
MNKIKNKYKEALILAIDTSCDDTSVAVFKGRRVLSSVISSQVELHKKWGGVVPTIAKRAHQDNIEKVYQEALKRARIKEEEIEFVAVTYGPGLAIALEVGIEFAKNLAYTKKKKLVPINHMEGHMLASFILNSKGNGAVALNKEATVFPALALLISGNHSEIVYAEDINKYKILGETLDDAAGEAFDKVARMMNLGYPGGAIITLLAGRASKKWSDIKAGLKERDEKKPLAELAGRFGLPVPMMRSKELNFSFSGLKTACLYKIKSLREKYPKDTSWSYDFAREFINAVSRSLLTKLGKAIKLNPEIKSIIVGGGVSNNKYIIREVGTLAKKENKKYFIPETKFRSDNAGMIAIAAYYNINNLENWLEGEKILELDRKPMLRL